MNDKMRYGILAMLFTMMGIMVCFKCFLNSGWQESLLGIASVMAGMYYFVLIGKQNS